MLDPIDCRPELKMDATTDKTGPADLKRETDSPTDELDDELPEAPASVSRGDRDSTTRRLGRRLATPGVAGGNEQQCR